MLAALVIFCFEFPRGVSVCAPPFPENELYQPRRGRFGCGWSVVKVRMNFDERLRASAELL